jgi:hypothetical protein
MSPRLMPTNEFIVVARPHNMIGLDVPTNVKVRTELPLGETMNILAHSRLFSRLRARKSHMAM